LAIVGAFWSSIGVGFATGALNHQLWPVETLLGFFGGCTLVAVAGMFDDIRPLGAKKKLALQIAAATIAWYSGVRIIETLSIPAVGVLHLNPILSYLATLIWILAFTNAINLIDGLDGLAGGVVFFACLTNLVVAIVSDNVLAAIVNAGLGAAVLGFLFYNFNPATIFMGDTGSMFLGFALGSAALLTGRQKESTLVSLLVPIVALGLPLADTLLAMIRRVVAKRSIFSADREHLHHRLVDIGLTHKRAVLTLYGCSVLLCAAAMAAAFGRDWQVGAAILGAVVTLLGITKSTKHFELILSKKLRRLKLLEGSASSFRRVVPRLIVDLHSAETAIAVWATFEKALDEVEVVASASCGPQSGRREWQYSAQPQSTGRQEGQPHEVEFVLNVFPGRKDRLTLVLRCDEPVLPPQTEIQLQLVADALQDALLRLNVAHPRGMIRAVEDSDEALATS
jgi:UDP-GlcNAc:undecaprenyl-phosphate GlcNAc-1-phosphate transferase